MTEEIRRFGKEDIGGELLPILTTGLYRDVLDTLREYIQNSIDAKAKCIELRVDPDQIVINDDGIGMNRDDARKAIRLGISDKNPVQNVGFRGIGIYSAFNLCDNVEMFTKHKNDGTYRISFNFKNIREEILKEQERRKNNLKPELYLEKLLNESVQIMRYPETIIEGHGTKVILSGLLSEVYERLNNWYEVSAYLEKVVPLPFRKDFKFAKTIEEKFKEQDYNIVPLTLQIVDRRGELFRPYSNDLFHHGGGHDVKFFDLRQKNQHFGFAWICINDARAVLRNKSMRGLLIKKFGFSINDRNFLEPYFPRPVFYRRMTGEMIVQNENLIPNAARSDFEYNSTRQAFFQYLPKFIGDVSKWANEIQEEDLARDVLAEIMNRLQQMNAELTATRRNKEKLLLFNNSLQNIERDLNPQKKTLKSIANDKLEKAEDLLKFCKDFVTSALTQTQVERKKLEGEISSSINKRKITLTDEEKERISQQPRKISDLIEAFGFLKDDESQKLIRFIDENILQQYLSLEDYEESLDHIRNFLETRS
jgi:hypothetical protein